MAESLRSRWGLVAVLGALVLYGIVVVRCAWVGDDSFITLRTLDNLLSGHGLRYNVLERVQAYTHPLWLAILAVPYTLSRDPYGSALAAGFVVSLGTAVGLSLGIARDAAAGVLALTVLIGSKAAVDYATSGLENPLTHALLVATAAVLLRPRPEPWALVLLTSLLALSRPDAVLLTAPVVAWALWQGGRATWGGAAAGAAPLVAWALFAFVYYGSVLPNTAYAKLGTGLSRADLHAQGWHYLGWTWANDPLTPLAVLGGLAAAAWTREGRWIALAAGGALYVVYVWHIGGDFMGGRFFTAPLVVAAIGLARAPWPHPAVPAALAVLALGGSLTSRTSPLRSGPDYERVEAAHGVVDERGYYWDGAGLWGESTRPLPSHAFVQDGRAARARGVQVKVKSVIGFYGYYAGSDLHVIDRLGLADPLLARLPASFAREWRVGHHRRHVPEGYRESVVGDNRVVDPEVRAFNGAVREVTRGPVWSRRRLWTALRLQVGAIEVPRLAARYPGALWLSALPSGPVAVDAVGLGLPLGREVSDLELTLTRDGWIVLLERGDRVLAHHALDAGVHRLPVTRADRIVLLPTGRAELRSIVAEGAP